MGAVITVNWSIFMGHLSAFFRSRYRMGDILGGC